MSMYMQKFKDYNDSMESLCLSVSNVRIRSEKSIQLIQDVIVEIKNLVLREGFESTEKEIQFFKQIKPHLIAHKIANSIILDCEIRKMTMSEDEFETLKKRKLSFIQDHFIDFKEFYFYLQSESNFRDDFYFTQAHTKNDVLLKILPELDIEFSTGYDCIAGYILAYDLIKEYFKDLQHDKHYKSYPELKWSFTKADLVELIYALHIMKVFDNGKTDIIKLANAFSVIMDMDLKDIYRTFNAIKERKKITSRFLTELLANFNSRIKELD